MFTFAKPVYVYVCKECKDTIWYHIVNINHLFLTKEEKKKKKKIKVNV